MEQGKTTGHLRLHFGEEPIAVPPADDTPLDRLCLGISALSGWQIERISASSAEWIWSRKLPATGWQEEWLGIRRGAPGGPPSIIPEGLICELVGYLGEIVAESRHCQTALAAREAELATAIPVVVDVNADGLRLARRLESILAGGARALECDAAALYLLDDATEHLKLRCQWNLGVAALAESPRPLAGAAADLEALAGHAIAIEDARRGGRWRAPRASGAALCVPVASATTLLGTLWLFSERPRTFSDHDTNLWEIIAGRLAAELEREAILRERLPHHPRPDDAMIQQALPPRTKRELKNKDWLATTRVPATEQDRTVIVDLHESDPTIQAIAIAAHDDGVAGASLASRTYAKWYQQRQGSDFLSTAHESLFRESTGDHFVSAVTVELDKHSGDVTLHAAGHIESYLIRPYAWEPWTLPTTPLGDVTATQVGRGTTTNLAANDWLLVIVGARPRTLKVHNVTLIDGKCLAETLLRLHELEIDHAADALWRLVQEHQAVWQQTPSLMLVRRFAEVHRDILEENGCRRRS